jgi:hypothetical protein
MAPSLNVLILKLLSVSSHFVHELVKTRINFGHVGTKLGDFPFQVKELPIEFIFGFQLQETTYGEHVFEVFFHERRNLVGIVNRKQPW